MVRNIALLSGSSHPNFSQSLSQLLGIPSPASRILGKFSSGESRCEIQDSVRGKDVFIIQTFGVGTGQDKVNDYLVELLIMISACKTGSAKRVTAVLPLFPYSRQPDASWSAVGAPKGTNNTGSGTGKGEEGKKKKEWTFESVPVTPGLAERTKGLVDLGDGEEGIIFPAKQQQQQQPEGILQETITYTTHDYENPTLMMALNTTTSQSKSGGGRGGFYKQWMAQSGSLVADLLTCAGADRVLTCDLHESTYQGFFDIPVDNLFARPLLKQYIEYNILPEYKGQEGGVGEGKVVIVSPDAGGAKRASAIADGLSLGFALIHKERRAPNKFTSSGGTLGNSAGAAATTNKATMMLVGDVADRVCILIDDLADTANTITRAAKLLKREGATKVIALLTHGIFSGDAIERINASALDKVVVTNTIAQGEHCAACPKLEVLDMSPMFAEAIRRVHHGESISVLFQYD
ncbi:ribose-phosphate pyrophosphokinase 5 [Cladorrhinum sp. PSN259]|nr:ribose-phosphate pyrophosphokinase 5 [Cladorrhinum sp. PSN259]